MKKKILIVCIMLVLISAMCIVYMIIKKNEGITNTSTEEFSNAQSENIDYNTLVDDECGFAISQFLEIKDVSYRNQDEYEMKFILKSNCENDLDKELSSRFTDDFIKDSNLYIGNSAMEKEIKAGDIKHIYSFFREGKVMDASGFHAMSVQIRICVVEIDGRQYIYIYS